jgi:hypothetical protein
MSNWDQFDNLSQEEKVRLARVDICEQACGLRWVIHNKEDTWPCVEVIRDTGAPVTAALVRQAYALFAEANKMFEKEVGHVCTEQCKRDKRYECYY